MKWNSMADALKSFAGAIDKLGRAEKIVDAFDEIEELLGERGITAGIDEIPTAIRSAFEQFDVVRADREALRKQVVGEARLSGPYVSNLQRIIRTLVRGEQDERDVLDLREIVVQLAGHERVVAEWTRERIEREAQAMAGGIVGRLRRRVCDLERRGNESLDEVHGAVAEADQLRKELARTQAMVLEKREGTEPEGEDDEKPEGRRQEIFWECENPHQ